MCRRAVICGINADLQTIINEEIITDQSFKEEVKEFYMIRKWDFQEREDQRTTHSDIIYIDKIITHTIRLLKEKYNI